MILTVCEEYRNSRGACFLMATACANLNSGKTSNITGMNPLENTEHVMLQWGEKA